MFLTAEWRHLAILNYAVEPAVVEPYVPRGLELDFWNGQTLWAILLPAPVDMTNS